MTAETWLDLARTDGHRFEQWANDMARAASTHPVETLGAPGSTGTPSRWPQSSDDTGERGDTQNTGANRGRIGVGGSKGYGQPVEGGVNLDGPEPQTTAVCGSG